MSAGSVALQLITVGDTSLVQETKSGKAARLYDILTLSVKATLDATAPAIDPATRLAILQGQADIANRFADWDEDPIYEHGTVSSGTATIDFNNGRSQRITLGASTTFSFLNVPTSGMVDLHIIQDGSGSRLATWPGASSKFRGGSGDATLSTPAGSIDLYCGACAGAVVGFLVPSRALA